MTCVRIVPVVLALVCTGACVHVEASPRSGSPGASSRRRIRVEYRPPSDPALRRLYAEMREGHLLERLAEGCSVLRLPRTLTLSFSGCHGESNAWYDPDDATVTFCYEYVADIRRLAASGPRGKVTPEEARDGPVTYTFLHEIGHAVFDLLRVPVLGREEDAADTFATVILLRLGRAIAFHTLRGAAWEYAMEARRRTPTELDLADVHGLDAQRYYNTLCLAYGSDPKFFAAAVSDGGLPAERAEGCAEEYQQALYAVHELIAPAVDAHEAARLRARHGTQWEHGG